MSLRWITARGYRVTLALAALFALFHAVVELRALAGGSLSFVQRLELTALDVKLGFRGPRVPDPWRVAVAAIDERALHRFGPLPWDRRVHAELVERLTDLQAGAIAFDMTFDRPAAGDAREALQKVNGAFGDNGLRGAASHLESIAGKIASRRPGSPAAKRLTGIAEGLAGFESQLASRSWTIDPDAAFSDAVRASGRVVLGVVAYSKREAEALAKTAAGGGLDRVASSTITRVVLDSGDGLARILDGRDHFRGGLYRRYFDLQAPTPNLAAASPHFGLINAAPDPDGVNRRMPLVATIKASGIIVPSLALKAAQVALQAPEIEILADPESPAPDGVRIGALTVDTELGASTTIDWMTRFDPETFPIVSVVDVLDGNVPREKIRGRAVFVAATAVGTHDQRVTPLERAVPGVYVHATLAQNILEGRQLIRPTYAVLLELVLLLAIGGIAGVLMARFRVWGQIATALGLSVCWVVVDQLLFTYGLVIVLVLPLLLIFFCLLAMSMWSYLVEQRERRQTRAAFAQYLSPQVLERVLAEPEEYLKLGGRRYDATVLFSDIRGFTTISESLTPEELGRLLNEYMTPMTNIVFAHQGTLDKYIGDAVMAFWGAPVEQGDHALGACRAALEMQAEVTRLNRRFIDEGLPTLSIGVGLSTGPMTIGNMGSDDHFAYTALGDRVNLGARLEGLTKEYGVGVMISEVTQRRVADDMLCRELGAIRVKGKNEPVRIYELLGAHGEVGELKPFVDTFHRALMLFQARKWDAAAAEFDTARAQRGLGDRACDLYIQWCRDYKTAPPPLDWDGVRVATTK